MRAGDWAWSVAQGRICTILEQQGRRAGKRSASRQFTKAGFSIVLEVRVNENLHDREIRLDNGWVIKLGRGLDFYQKPESWYALGASDFSLRKCLETKVDIFRADVS